MLELKRYKIVSIDEDGNDTELLVVNTTKEDDLRECMESGLEGGYFNRCAICDEWVSDDSMVKADNNTYCEDCCEKHEQCPHCGEIIVKKE